MMPLIFEKPEAPQSILPFQGFPVEVKLGSSSAVLYGDVHSSTLVTSYLQLALLEKLPVYHVSVGGSYSPGAMEKLGKNLSEFYFGRAYSLSEIADAVSSIEEGSAVFISGFSLLPDLSPKGILELVDLADGRGLTLVLSHFSLSLNELDLPGEFRSHFYVPEIFDYLLVARTSSYRGHYRLNLSILKAPSEYLGRIGDHSIQVDGLIKPLL